MPRRTTQPPPSVDAKGQVARRAGLVVAVLAAMVVQPAAAGAVDGDDRITPKGLGPIRVGMSVDRVREANGGVLGDVSNGAGDGSCATAELGDRVSSLFTRGVLGRVDVRTRRYRTAAGVRVGDSARAVRRAYGRKVTSVPAPYDPTGRELRVTTGNGRLVFITRSSGRITSISTGRFPEITYIEGCA